MVNLALSIGKLLLAFFLVFLNGFFVASEFALVRIRASTVETLANADRTGSVALQRAVDNLDDYLATTQLGITIASLGLGWIGEPAVATLLEPVLAPVLPGSLLHLIAFIIAFGFITFLHVVFGELAPKTIAIQKAEAMALFVAPPMRLFYFLFLPGIIVFNGTANAFTRLVGVESAGEAEETVSEEELLLILSRSGREGLVDHGEVEMIRQIFELDDTTVREVMTPRPDTVWIDPGASLPELRDLVEENRHTRYPVVDEDSDTVEGFIDVKDLLVADSETETALSASEVSRELPVVPEMTTIDDLLGRLQDEQSQMAAVIDEFGALEGIVTVEDVVEEVVGDIYDTFDTPAADPSMHELSDGIYSIAGRVSVSAVAERLGVDLADEQSQTIGGVVLERLGRAPEVGDSIDIESFEFEVTATDSTQVTRIVARRVEREENGSEETG